MTATDNEPMTPLDMARDWAERVYQIAAHVERREREEPGFGRIEAHIHGAGRQQFEAAQMASYMALVSMAEDVHALVADLHHDIHRIADSLAAIERRRG